MNRNSQYFGPDRRGIVRGQRVNPAELKLARQLRKEMTDPERRLWACIRNRRLDGLKFRRQQVIDGFIVDFYCHEVGLVVELDGDPHIWQAQRDADRSRALAERSLKVLRFHNDQVELELPSVLKAISNTARSLRKQSVPTAGSPSDPK